MSEFLGSYGFFILIALLMVICHLGHGGHGGHGRRRDDEPGTGGSSPGGGHQHWKVMTWSLGLFCAVSFVLCVLYGFVVPKTLHMVQFLEITLPGFRWLSPGGFVLGLVESFLYGAYAGLVFAPIYNLVARRCR